MQDLQFSANGSSAIHGSFMIGGQLADVGGVHVNYGTSGAGTVFLGVNNAKVFNSFSGLAANFHLGAAVGGSHSDNFGLLRQVLIGNFVEKTEGNFAAGQSGFVGFQFANGVDGGGKGWIRVKVAADGIGLPEGLEVIDWAYNDAGGGITAGQTVGAVPEPGSKALALLALGSAGVLAWRKRRNAAAN